MVIDRQIPGRDLVGEGGQSPAEIGELIEQLLRLNVGRLQEVTQNREVAVDGVEKPEVRYIRRRKVGEGLVLLAAAP